MNTKSYTIDMRLQDFLQEHPKQSLIFDFDKTLFTLHLPWQKYWEEMKGHIGELDPSLASGYTQEDIKPLIIQAIEKHGDKARNIINPYRQWFETTCLEQVTSNDDLISFVRNNQTEYHFSIWSSNARVTVINILKEYQLDRIFETVVSADDVHLIKPYPDGFDLIFNPQEHKKSDFLLIGDSVQDKGASRNAGIDYFDVLETM